ncbi:hypothetical protein JOC78_000634 [Bacillus ectoiniformans]|nr:hypothetical protein [Bacillus ectoiniformans]
MRKPGAKEHPVFLIMVLKTPGYAGGSKELQARYKKILTSW